MQSESRPVERLECPPEVAQRLIEVGGLNRYGDANFKVAWAQTAMTRQGGEWTAEGEQFEGYRDVLLGDGLPHWMLLQWVDAGKCAEMPHLPPESDVAFYIQNKCPKTNLQILGEYPYHGSYQIVQQLMAKWIDGGILKIHAFPLSSEIVEMMVPIIKASMEISVEAKLRFMREENERDEQQYNTAVEDLYQSVKLPAHVRTSKWIADKERSIEKHWNAALMTTMSQHRFAQGRPNA